MINGMLAGKFMPLHRGHMELIRKALSECDHLDIIHSFSNADLERCSKEIGHDFVFDPLVIYQWLTSAVSRLNASSRVGIHVLDETGFAPYPLGVVEWGDAVLKRLGRQPDKIFTGDACYQVTYKTKFPDSEVILVTPENRDLRATVIRSNFLAHKQDVPSWVAFNILEADRRNSEAKICDLQESLRSLLHALSADWAPSYIHDSLQKIRTQSAELIDQVSKYV